MSGYLHQDNPLIRVEFVKCFLYLATVKFYYEKDTYHWSCRVFRVTFM